MKNNLSFCPWRKLARDGDPRRGEAVPLNDRNKKRGTEMDWKIFISTFGSIFLAELGDKTQLAAILMTSKTGKPLSVFVEAVAALSLVTFIGVVFGEGLISVIPQNVLKKVAVLAFILIGAWMFFGK
jgi:putative Ca2+/H+ antiporter (TMEM165/GDT1 family)